MNAAYPTPSPDRPAAVVIGAGIAGLACTLRLQAAGFSVTLLERHEHVGGKIRTLQSQAGPVAAGPTVLTMRPIFEELFAAAGERLEAHVGFTAQHILARHFWPDGSTLDLHADTAANIRAIETFAGRKAAEEFRRFHQRTATLFEAFDAPMMQAAEPDMARLAPLVMARPSLLRAMAPLSTLAESLSRQFSDPRLAQLFGRYATYVGGSPYASPALLSLIWQAEAGGVWTVDGGIRQLAEAVAGLCTRLGACIRLHTHVAEIAAPGGAITTVTLDDGTRLAADCVVFAGDPRALATGALGSDMRAVAAQCATAPRSFSARVYSFAARAEGPTLAHHNVFFDADPAAEFTDLAGGRTPHSPTLYICAEDRGNDRAPDGLERFEIIANAPSLQEMSEETELAPWHQSIIQKMAGYGLRFSPEPTLESITTPQHFEAMFPASCGALYGQSPHGMTAALKRPRARTAIRGLYLCGGGTHPGAGVPMATISARHAAEAILRDRTSMSRSARTAMPGGTSTA